MRELIPVVTEMLKDDEFLAGGIFTKEEYYKEKFNLTHEQMVNIETCLYYALNIKDDDFNKKVSNMNKY